MTRLVAVYGISANRIMEMPASSQLLLVNGQGPLPYQRANYLTDRLFRGRYGPNPMYAKPARRGRSTLEIVWRGR